MELKKLPGEPDRKTEVLIVEDNTEIANFLKTLLADRYSVVTFSQGKDAINYIESTENNIVVVLDYRLPDMSGLEVLRRIKKMKPHIPVIFITGYGDEQVAVRAFRYGVRDYLKKPFSYAEFLQTLERSLSLAFSEKHGPRKVLIDDVDGVAAGIINAADNSAVKYNLQKAMIFIKNNYMNKISLDDVAREACTSKYHFSREFKKSVGCTYKYYVSRIRIEKAREILRSTRMSITETAFSVGYPDLTNFERTFKKITGCTPREYKNRETGKSAGS